MKTFLGSLLSLALLPAFAAAIEKPNVILMMADDMGMGDTSAYQDFTGNADGVQLATPNMERLARMGVRFTDAHTPASRCSPTRYGLLTGRYSWRNRLKHWVLFGSQGDPMIEADRPTLATLFRDAGYGTAMVGKWHVGLRYRQSNGKPAAGWADAALTQPLHTTPVDHGFDYAHFTSRSHGTSGPDAGGGGRKGKKNGPNQSVGPGHLHGRIAIAATNNGKQLIDQGAKAYVLTKLGGRHSDHALEYLDSHQAGGENADKPFFLYYPANANHGPYTPDLSIGGKAVKGASRTKAGEPMDARHDLIYENDIALGRLLDYLEANDDPRHPGKKLIETTLVIFTSDNGAEKNSDIASGPFRSHKGSCFEGGHRVPFIVEWGDGGIGDGDPETPGQTNATPIGLTDCFATFAELIGVELPDLRDGEKGAEDSFSVLASWHGEELKERPPMFYHDHKEAKGDPAVGVMRLDDPKVGDKRFAGQWKIFFDATLLRGGVANPFALYDLKSDQWEENNRISEPELAPLVNHLEEVALLHRNAGGHRLAPEAEASETVTFDWRDGSEAMGVEKLRMEKNPDTPNAVTLTIRPTGPGGEGKARSLQFNPRGIGVSGGEIEQVDGGEALLISFDRDVIVESAAVVAGNGVCGGFYQVGDKAPLAIYCIDGDIDAKDQQGVLSDIGVLKKGEVLRLDSSPHFDVETPGRWRLGALSVRPL